jgi:catechol 2,3-dioxygenase-like lactoylglutathione lyase family enzyme
MATDGFRVDGIDHVALHVPDRDAAAEWYEAVLGFEVCEDYELWADRGGPLVTSTDGGDTMLALFARDEDHPGPGHLAFRTDAAGFADCLDHLATREDVAVSGPADVVDHALSWSVYFEDPWGHSLEVTTYEYDDVEAALAPDS